jgi:hypothetical protein
MFAMAHIQLFNAFLRWMMPQFLKILIVYYSFKNDHSI